MEEHGPSDVEQIEICVVRYSTSVPLELLTGDDQAEGSFLDFMPLGICDNLVREREHVLIGFRLQKA